MGHTAMHNIHFIEWSTFGKVREQFLCLSSTSDGSRNSLPGGRGRVVVGASTFLRENIYWKEL